MVLQRWQTVYLLVAIAAMIVFLVNPMMDVRIDEYLLRVDTLHVYSLQSPVGEDPDMFNLNMVWVMVLGVAAIAVAAWTVVVYRKLDLQRLLAGISGVVSGALGIGVLAIGLFAYSEKEVMWHWTAFLPLVASALTWLALYAIRRDQKLIESADRLWD